MNIREAHFKQLLDKKLKQSRYKQLKCIIPFEEINSDDPSKPILNFSSGDFLGLSNHPFVKKNTIKYVLKWGAGSSASRLMTSHLERQHELEKKLASSLNKEATFFLNPVQNIHELTLTPLGAKDTIFFIDDSVSNLIKKAAKLSSAQVIYFPHNNITKLTSLIEAHCVPTKAKVIVSESIFHTVGDFAPLPELCKLASHSASLLYIDDSLSFSSHGFSGFGLAAPRMGVDIAISGFGRSCGAFGNFVATSETLKEYLIQFCPELSSVTLLPPAALGAIDAAIGLIPDMHEERNKMKTFSLILKEALGEKELNIGDPKAHIFPIQFSCDQELLHCYSHLVEEQILVQNIKNSGLSSKPLLRFIISASHSKEQINALISRFKSWSPPLQYEKAFN
ncbi:MAG: pyridoxal phosphate-dependent aminotransferase family protein [Rhabdochlamydiaceae bacterium]|nr:pyridoxal phosphate-dependent aminotransferase family protein [Candidatus Amphrikana amoebophyrae]